MQQFRAFINSYSYTDRGWLTTAWLRVMAFDINEDGLAKATSTFDVAEMPDNIAVGDIFNLCAPQGMRIYVGVIDKIEDLKITTSQAQAYYKGQWVYQTRPDITTGIGHEIMNVMTDYMNGNYYNSTSYDQQVRYRNSHSLFDTNTSFMLDSIGDISGNLPEDDRTMDFEDFLYECADRYNIGYYANGFLQKTAGMPFSDTLTIESKRIPNRVISDNSRYISNAEIISTTQEVNRLEVYSNEKALRQVYYATTESVTTNANDPLRIYPVVTKIVFSDDDLNAIKEANIQAKTYNHQLKFDVELGNPYFDNTLTWRFGYPFTVSIQGHVFDTMLTGRKITKDANKDLTKITFVCGKARTSLTKKLLAQGVI